MFKAYVVDDEPLARDELKYILNKTKKAEVLGESDNIEDALADITMYKPDIVFLDIQLDEESGLTLAKRLEELHPVPAICFVTAYDEYALQAFDSNAVDYVLKPYDEKRIERTLDKLKNMKKNGEKQEVQLVNQRNDMIGKLAFTVEERFVLIPPDEIIYLGATEGKCKIKTLHTKYIVTETLASLAKKLEKSHFLRVHRSFIVNINRIIEIEPWFNSTYNLLMDDGSKVPVSRTYIKHFKQIIGLN